MEVWNNNTLVIKLSRVLEDTAKADDILTEIAPDILKEIYSHDISGIYRKLITGLNIRIVGNDILVITLEGKKLPSFYIDDINQIIQFILQDRYGVFFEEFASNIGIFFKDPAPEEQNDLWDELTKEEPLRFIVLQLIGE